METKNVIDSGKQKIFIRVIKISGMIVIIYLNLNYGFFFSHFIHKPVQFRKNIQAWNPCSCS